VKRGFGGSLLIRGRLSSGHRDRREAVAPVYDAHAVASVTVFEHEVRGLSCLKGIGFQALLEDAKTQGQRVRRGTPRVVTFGEVGLLLLGFRCRRFLGKHDFLERHQRELDHPLMHDRPLRPLPHRNRADSNAESLSEGRLAQAERFPAGLELFGRQMITITRS
jgi:hypothetical protein